MRTCANCGTSIEHKRSDARFCSRDCQVAAHDGSRRTKKEGVFIRLGDDMKDRLTDEAEARGVSMTWLVSKLLAEALAELRPANEFTLTRERGT